MSKPELAELTIGILGGTGAQGRGLAYRWSLAGLKVLSGSRDSTRAQQVAAEISQYSGTVVTGLDNESCADSADIVVLAVPWSAHYETISALQWRLSGKIVIDCVNPLGFDSNGPYVLPVPEGSAAQQAASLLPAAKIVAAFHHVSAVLLADPKLSKVETDVLVLGDDRPAIDLVCALADCIAGLRGIYAGRLRNAGQVEALTANLIAINKRYRAHAGVHITGISHH